MPDETARPGADQTSGEDGRSVSDSLRAVLDGDPLAMPVISSVNHEDLAAVADGEVGGLVVTKKAVIRVLEGLLAASWTPEQAHVWATFVRWGVAGTWVKGEKGRRDLMPIAASVPYFPLDIEFDEADEDRIVEVVARLDEIGDFIDGHVSTREQHQLLEFLRQP